MNFLEQLAAEYYAHMGYFVKTNVKFDRLKGGGWGGEMDVVAFHPTTLNLIHIETSMDAEAWEKREGKFRKKFLPDERYYQLFNFLMPNSKIQKLAIVGFNKVQKSSFFEIAPIKSIPEFIGEITDYLSQYHPLRQIIPENYSLLRAMQLAIHYDERLNYKPKIKKPKK